MMSKRRSSKRVTRIPLKFGDSVCTFTSKKNKHKKDDLAENKDDNRSDTGNECNNEGDSCEEEFGGSGEQGNAMRSNEVLKEGMDVNNVSDVPSHSNVSTPEPPATNTVNNGNDVNTDKVAQSSPIREINEIRIEPYAKIVSSGNDDLSKQLNYIPTGINENGDEVVIFEEELVREGSKKWQLTICGQFVRCNMPIGELKYNLRRMWGRHGLAEIIAEGNDLMVFKFKNAEGMNYVLDQSLWMVNGKPLVVQKWDPNVCFEKAEPCKIPIWVKLLNVPLEAWSVRGISALASRLGKPIMMDNTTVHMCHHGSGRAGYARILVEIEAKKGIHDKIKIVYKDALNCTKQTKFVKVEYNWKPALCVHCEVFGHSDKTCKVQMKNDEGNLHGKNQKASDEGMKNGRNEMFTEVRRRQKNRTNFGGPGTSNFQNNQKRVISKYVVKNKNANVNDAGNMAKGSVKGKEKVNNEGNQSEKNNDKPPSLEKIWKVNSETMRNLKKSANKYAVLSTEEEEVGNTYDMKQYFKYRWEALNRNDDDNEDENEVMEVNDPAVVNLIPEEIQGGINNELKQNEAENLIRGEKIQVEEHAAVLKKLDRILVNDGFMKQYEKAHGVFLPYGISDHSPSVLIIQDGYSQKNKAFRFSNFVAGKDKFVESVKNGWKDEVQGCHMFRLIKKMKNLKKPLKKLSPYQGNVHDRSNALKDELKIRQEAVDKNPFDKNVRIKAAQVLSDYMEASKDELSLLHQKSKIQWLREGDKNTAYFHSIIKTRRNKNRVKRIKDEKGTIYEGKDIAEQFVIHFKNFLGESKAVRPIEDIIFTNNISAEDADNMTREVTSKEIKEAIFDIDSNKASGPDGFSSEFFKKAWEFVGDDVCMAVKEFFRNGKILKEVNATLIALIPKIPTPSKVSEFRPIACCNVIYKCVVYWIS
ncbi:RNA-directed DNA polymerase, eukaryota, reverse transcriptase zinc-binding domain protein [Tanacetum coccineum]